jgi:hypothetical protein
MHHIRAVTRSLVVLVALHVVYSQALFKRTAWAVSLVYFLFLAAAMVSDLTPRDSMVVTDIFSPDVFVLPLRDRLALVLVVLQLSTLFVLDRVFLSTGSTLFRAVLSFFIIFVCFFLIFLRWVFTSVLVVTVPGAIYLYRKLLVN